MALLLTRGGTTTAVSLHPENTPRKALSLHLRDLSQTSVPVRSLGGVELSLAQCAAMYQAHWSLLRKESGPEFLNRKRGIRNPEWTGEGIFANDFSRQLVKELVTILSDHKVSKVDAGNAAQAKKFKAAK